MMLTLVSLFATALLAAQTAADPRPPFRAADADASPRIARLRAEATNRRAIAAFWADVRASGAPLVEPSPSGDRYSLVTFVWRGSSKTRNVVIEDGVAAGVGGPEAANSQLQRLPGSDVWYRTYDVRNDARFTYKLAENDSLRSFIAPNRVVASVVDPLNPRVFRTGHSYLELREAPPLLPERDAATLAGSVETARFASPTSGNEYTGWVYLPPGFRREGAAYPLIVVMDGQQYTTVVPGPAILDDLIARGRIRPTVGVFLDTSFARASQLSCSRPFSDVLAADIVPRIRSSYNAGTIARDAAIAGSSLGGLASACAAIAHPEVFGLVLSQSGSFWWPSDAEPEWLTREVRQTPMLPLRLFVEVGAMEIPQQLDTNRRLREALIASGAAVDYREFNGNHAYLPWRGGFADGLVSLFGSPR